MPDKARHYQGRRRGKRREARRPVPQSAAGAPPRIPTIPPQVASVPERPAAQATSAAKLAAKTSAEPVLKVTPVRELKRIGIVAGSMFLILFILAFILK